MKEKSSEKVSIFCRDEVLTHLKLMVKLSRTWSTVKGQMITTNRKSLTRLEKSLSKLIICFS